MRAPGHPPLAGFFGEVQEPTHDDPDRKVARGANILSSLRQGKLDLPADDLDDSDDLGDRGLRGFS
ncbi:hypothetical protein DF286_08250 [Sphingosinicella humi]|uniref:Uncharacterized protein n=2 Tax=Allosphingosinicella humi TaxID=2068657 RepID=A0A2U2J3K7_9SPHN|nr:hypothetical protein DF286_08250 [Sphingosinicella humi]